MNAVSTMNAAKIACALTRACEWLTDYNQKILTFRSIYDYFALLISNKPQNTNSLRDKCETQYHRMVFEGELAVKLFVMWMSRL